MLFMLLHIPLFLIVLSFLGLNLVISLCARHKPTTFREYAVGNKRFSTSILVATLLASHLGADMLIGYKACFYSLGGVTIIHFLLNFFLTVSIVRLLWLRISPLMKHFSIAETIGHAYGKYPRVITALFTLIYCLSKVGLQISIMCNVVHTFIESVDYRIITILVTLILIAHSILRGIHSVTHTGVLQFVIFVTIVALLARLCFAQTGKSILEIVSHKQERFQWSDLDHNTILHLVLGGLYWSLTIYEPWTIQRVYMASSPFQVKKVFLYSAFLYLFIIFILRFTGLCIFVKEPNLLQQEIVSYMMAYTSCFLQGCIVVCILGIAMFTAAFCLHLCSILITHDILESIRTVNPITDSYKIRVAKLALLISGLLAMIIAIYCNDLFAPSQYIGYFMSIVFSCTTAAPFILAVFGFRSTSRIILIGIVIGTLSIFLWRKLFPGILLFTYYIGPIITTGLAMMAAHYLLPQPAGKGWIGRNNKQKRIQQLIQAFEKYKKSIDRE